MRSFIIGLSCLSVVALPSCSDESDGGGAADGVAVAGGSASVGAGGAGAAGDVASNGGDAGSPASTDGASAGGSSSELGVGGAIALEPGGDGSSTDGADDDGADDDGADDADGEGPAPDTDAPPVANAVCPAGPFAANPLEGAAEPEIVCNGMMFTEGPVWFAERNQLFFSDFQLGNAASNGNGLIWSFTPGGACEPFITDAGTNGLAIGLDGNLLGARHFDQTLTSFDLETREPTVFLADNDGLAFNSPNDIAVRSDGNIYFTDPDFLRGNRAQEQPTRAYRLDPSGALSVISENSTPNGITLSPDESRLYVSQFGGGASIAVYDIDAAGAFSNEQTFIAGTGSDGMAVDCAGNLYITQQGVQVFSPTGDPIGTINAPGAANVAFGGADRRTLFITATTTLRAVELAIPGLPY